MKKYYIQFRGRFVNAIGCLSQFTEKIEAANKEAAILKLYDKYDFIQILEIAEV